MSRAGGDTPVSHCFCFRRTFTLLFLLRHFLPFFWGTWTGWGRTEIHFHMVLCITTQPIFLTVWTEPGRGHSSYDELSLIKNTNLSSSSSSSDDSLKNNVFLSIMTYRNDTRTTMRTLWMAQYRFFFFFFDFFFSRWGDGEALSELLTEGMKVSDLVFTVRTISALVFIFSPVSVLVFLFLLATALLGRRIGLVWIFHQPERTKAADLESGPEIKLADDGKCYTAVTSNPTGGVILHSLNKVISSYCALCRAGSLCLPLSLNKEWPGKHLQMLPFVGRSHKTTLVCILQIVGVLHHPHMDFCHYH